MTKSQSAPSGAFNALLFEPLLDHFNNLIEYYKAAEEELGVD